LLLVEGDPIGTSERKRKERKHNEQRRKEAGKLYEEIQIKEE
jgi:hypothetical protein